MSVIVVGVTKMFVSPVVGVDEFGINEVHEDAMRVIIIKIVIQMAFIKIFLLTKFFLKKVVNR